MLKTTFLKKKFSNPIVLASGILGVTAASLKKAVADGCGGVTTKSISLEERPGHPNPTLIGNKEFFINAVGLSNPGIKEAMEEIKLYKKTCKAPLIASIFAGNTNEFGEVTKKISNGPIDFLEVNISCPNVGQEFGAPFAYSTDAVQAITKIVKANTKIPIIVKLSPNAWNIGEIAKAAEAAGADALCVGNTISGMVIDVRARKPILHNKQGGISGPALFPIALKCVFDVYKAIKIPIIGTGGITTGTDALAMVMAGATLLGVGSAIYYRDATAFKLIAGEMEKIMKEEKIKTLEEIRGCAH